MGSEFFKFEDREYDIPFYNGFPPLTASKIVVLILGLMISFISPFVIPIEGYQIPKALIICLSTLIPVVYALKGNLSMVFRVPKQKDIVIIILGVVGIFVLTMLVNGIFAIIGVTASENSAINGALIVEVISIIIQLMGEELVKFISLALIVFAAYKTLGRKGAIILGIIVSQLIFSLLHIPAYGFDLVRLLLGIGVVWSILPIIYVKTKNIVVVYIIHLLFDLIGLITAFSS